MSFLHRHELNFLFCFVFQVLLPNLRSIKLWKKHVNLIFHGNQRIILESLVSSCLNMANGFFSSRKSKMQSEENLRRPCPGSIALQSAWCPDPFLAGLRFKLQCVLCACKWSRLRVSWHRSYMICNIWHNFYSVLEIPYKWARFSGVSSVSPGQEVGRPRIYRAEEVLGEWRPCSFSLGYRSEHHKS